MYCVGKVSVTLTMRDIGASRFCRLRESTSSLSSVSPVHNSVSLRLRLHSGHYALCATAYWKGSDTTARAGSRSSRLFRP